MKSKYIIMLVVLVAVAAGIWFFANPEENPSSSTNNKPNNTNNTSIQEQTTINSNSQTMVQEIPNALEGELKDSDNKKKGNLMLKLNDADRTIYLNTARDFSSLIGKQVVATIEGSLDDFVLLEIKEK